MLDAFEWPRAGHERLTPEHALSDLFEAGFPATITNPPKVAEIIFGPLSDAGSEIGQTGDGNAKGTTRCETTTRPRTSKECPCRNWQRWRQTWSVKSLLIRSLPSRQTPFPMVQKIGGERSGERSALTSLHWSQPFGRGAIASRRLFQQRARGSVHSAPPHRHFPGSSRFEEAGFSALSFPAKCLN